jgi:SpoVK/Ycf46/Vps4 family AAA+-type ATPase
MRKSRIGDAQVDNARVQEAPVAEIPAQESPVRPWEEANQICLMAALGEVRAAIETLLSRPDGPATPTAQESQSNTEEVRASMAVPPGLDTLCARFGLSSFERNIVLMCAGMELDSRFRSLMAAANKDRQPFPTFSLALAAFENAHWSGLLPERPLRFWHLVELSSGDSLTSSPLRIDERILHYLSGVASIDERLRGLTKFHVQNGELPSSQGSIAERIAGIWSRSDRQSLLPVMQLCGSDLAGKRAIAASACASLGLRLRVMPSHAVPRTMADLELFLRLCERDAVLDPSGLLLEYDDAEPVDAYADAVLKRFVETLHSPLLISTREIQKPLQRRVLSFELPRATASEQLQIWQKALGPVAAVLDGRVEALAAQFSLSAGAIHAAVAQATQPDDGAEGKSARASDGEPLSTAKDQTEQLSMALWDACRIQTRPRLEGLAQRIEPSAAWDDLVLPETEKQILRHMALHVRQRAKVYQTWGFASKSSRGLGISALFAGPSGTGKTMAGEVLASELRLDLYRIDLSQVVSKYIGETEKNLRRVFDAAEEGACLLLFDEADALFGKRSEVKDSHDRYANIEISYLLQRIESYRGLAILTTNRRDALDSAFLRRIRFVVEFPFPGAAQRAEIWRRVFPRQTPTEALRIDRLSRLNVAGGDIRNIAVGAAFLAADAGEPVRMSHLLRSARSEFTKLARPLTDSDTAGWV